MISNKDLKTALNSTPCRILTTIYIPSVFPLWGLGGWDRVLGASHKQSQENHQNLNLL